MVWQKVPCMIEMQRLVNCVTVLSVCFRYQVPLHEFFSSITFSIDY